MSANLVESSPDVDLTMTRDDDVVPNIFKASV
jgi:hypothetical protein